MKNWDKRNSGLWSVAELKHKVQGEGIFESVLIYVAVLIKYINVYQYFSYFYVFILLSAENVQPTAHLLGYSVAVQCDDSIEQNHTHAQWPMLCTM